MGANAEKQKERQELKEKIQSINDLFSKGYEVVYSQEEYMVLFNAQHYLIYNTEKEFSNINNPTMEDLINDINCTGHCIVNSLKMCKQIIGDVKGNYVNAFENITYLINCMKLSNNQEYTESIYIFIENVKQNNNLDKKQKKDKTSIISNCKYNISDIVSVITYEAQREIAKNQINNICNNNRYKIVFVNKNIVVFHKYNEGQNYIIWNINKDYKDGNIKGHGHLKSLSIAKSVANTYVQRKLPKTRNDFIIKTYLLISDDELYSKKIQDLIDVRRNKGKQECRKDNNYKKD